MANITPAHFQFSQASLQDYIDCRQRFYLRYIQRMACPAITSTPIQEQERRMDLGQQFHRLVHQFILGVPEAVLERAARADIDLETWWMNFRTSRPEAVRGDKYPEFTLSTVVDGFRVVAKYDLLVVNPGTRITILDWKTTMKRTPASILKARMQTRLYPVLAIDAGSRLFGGETPEAEHVSMQYWFPQFPETPVTFRYDAQDYAADRAELSRLIGEITQLDDDAWFKTEDVARCKYCVYRSLCDRGINAGVLDEEDTVDDALTAADTTGDWSLEDWDVDFDQIAEIAF